MQAETLSKVQVFIVVRGGVVQEVRSNCRDALDVEVMDYDDAEDDLNGTLKIQRQEDKMARCENAAAVNFGGEA